MAARPHSPGLGRNRRQEHDTRGDTMGIVEGIFWMAVLLLVGGCVAYSITRKD